MILTKCHKKLENFLLVKINVNNLKKKNAIKHDINLLWLELICGQWQHYLEKIYIFKTVKKITHSFIQSVSHSFHGSLTLLFATLWLDEEKKQHIALETTDHQHDYIASICYYKKRDIKSNYLGYICHFMDLFSTFSSIEYTYIYSSYLYAPF